MASDDSRDIEELRGKLTVDEDLLDSYDGPVPRHLAVIMDGNGRWATGRGLRRIRGHRAGAAAVRRTVESCRYLGADVLTLYAFSSENWQRPLEEVTGLMTLFDLYIKKEKKRLIANDIRLRVIGDRSRLSEKLQRAIGDLEEESAENEGMLLQVAVSYGGREELVRAMRGIAEEVKSGEVEPGEISYDDVERHLYTRGVPDPDLLVRTSGELRISNFLLWQIAYSELYVTQTFWPDFDETELLRAFREFGDRQRRFGKTGAQIEED